MTDPNDYRWWEGPTPRFLKRRARERMKVTGENYTTALRAVASEIHAERVTRGEESVLRVEELAARLDDPLTEDEEAALEEP